MDIFVDFSNIEQDDIGKKKETYTSLYKDIYDKTTCLYYKSYRIKKTDPITFEELNNENAFKFSQMWDPYTGMRKEEDPYGPLYFNPMTILQHIYLQKLNNLWIDDSDEKEGYYEGYYGESIGAGKNLEILGRGIYPERYLFRLPIPNCYLKLDHNMNLITMGPKLTDKEIYTLDRLITQKWSHHKLYKTIYKKIGSLFKLKCYYEIAIAKKPTSMNLTGIDICKKSIINKQKNPDAYLNRMAIEMIKKM